jgi:hypothetical protein
MEKVYIVFVIFYNAYDGIDSFEILAFFDTEEEASDFVDAREKSNKDEYMCFDYELVEKGEEIALKKLREGLKMRS